MLEDTVAGVLSAIIAKSGEQRVVESIRERYLQAEERYKRAQEVDLDGQIDRQAYVQELDQFERKRLLRVTIEAARIQGNALVAVKPTVAFRPIIDNWQAAQMGFSDSGEGGSLPHNHLLPSDLSLVVIPEKATKEEILAILAKKPDEPLT